MRAISTMLLLCVPALGCSGKTTNSSVAGTSGAAAAMPPTSVPDAPSEGGDDSVASSDETQGNGCEVCDGGCSNGLVTECLILDPPGCGAQSALDFCPSGCTPQGCNAYPVDGATAGCIASSATIQQGALLGASQAVAVTQFSSEGTFVLVATSKGTACSVTDDGGQASSGDGALLALQVAPNEAGREVIRPDHVVSQTTVIKTEGGAGMVIGGEAVVRLTVWKGGATVRNADYAISGSVSVNVYNPIGGIMGSYDLTFGDGDVEQGTFIAPACDPCTDAFNPAPP